MFVTLLPSHNMPSTCTRSVDYVLAYRCFASCKLTYTVPVGLTARVGSTCIHTSVNIKSNITFRLSRQRSIVGPTSMCSFFDMHDLVRLI